MIVRLLALALQDPPTPLDILGVKRQARAKIAAATIDPAEARPGQVAVLNVKVQIEPGWHIYSARDKPERRTRFEFLGAPLSVAAPVGEDPKPKKVSEPDGDAFQHAGDVTFAIPLKVSNDAPPSEAEIKGALQGQVCNATLCEPLELPISFKFEILKKLKRSPAQLAEVSAAPAEAKIGDVVELSVAIQNDPKYHVYSVTSPPGQRTEFLFPGMPVELSGPVKEPAPKETGEKELVHEGKPLFVIPLRITDRAEAPGELEVTGVVRGQVCSRVCVKFDHPFTFKLKLRAGRGTRVATVPPANSTAGSNELVEKAFFGFLGLCVLGGLISLIMPCVYPMLPITLTYFVKQGAGSRTRSISLSTAYGAGIIVSFTALGLALSLALGKSGATMFASNPWVNVALGVLFLAFALNLFGVFELRLPSALTNAVAGSPRSGVGGAFVLGLAFSVVTFTCVIPITGLLLAAAAEGHPARAAIGMLVYSFTMAAPFMLLGFFPGAIGNIPKSGGWLHNVKICAAFIELPLAIRYFAIADMSWGLGHLSRNLVILIWVASCVFTALYLIGVFRFREDTPLVHVGVTRVFVALFFAAFAVHMGTGLAGKSLGIIGESLVVYDPAEEISNARGDAANPGERHEAGWIQSYDEGLAKAKESNRPVFIDFTGVS